MDEVQARRLVETYADMIVRISYQYLKQTCDAEDICQTVLLKRLTECRVFESGAHEKAWIIRTTVNTCKDYLKSAFFRHSVPLEEAERLPAPAEPDTAVLDAVRTLPEKYGVTLYLFYYEGYSVKEIAEILGKRENTVSAWLSRGRRKLKQCLSAEREGTAHEAE